MAHATDFAAPWSASLKVITAASCVILGILALTGLVTRGPGGVGGAIWFGAMVVVPLGVLIGSAFFIIRGYRLSPNTLTVLRPGWRIDISLANLQSAEVDPNAMKSSWRIFGNGGLFCFAGRFKNRKLGTYRALATDPSRSVVLRFEDRVVVVTPDRPKKFVSELPGSE